MDQLTHQVHPGAEGTAPADPRQSRSAREREIMLRIRILNPEMDMDPASFVKSAEKGQIQFFATVFVGKNQANHCGGVRVFSLAPVLFQTFTLYDKRHTICS